MANENLSNAKKSKNDEFYTQYDDINTEMNAYIEYNPDVFRNKTILLPCDDPEWSNFTKYFATNFELLGIKKVISTSYAVESKNYKADYQPSLFEEENEKYDAAKTRIKGKIFVLERDVNKDEADIIITNPPFSLFREFMNWILEANKKFAIIGNMNALNYREIFPNVKANKIWIGGSEQSALLMGINLKKQNSLLMW